MLHAKSSLGLRHLLSTTSERDDHASLACLSTKIDRPFASKQDDSMKATHGDFPCDGTRLCPDAAFGSRQRHLSRRLRRVSSARFLKDAQRVAIQTTNRYSLGFGPTTHASIAVLAGRRQTSQGHQRMLPSSSRMRVPSVHPACSVQDRDDGRCDRSFDAVARGVSSCGRTMHGRST